MVDTIYTVSIVSTIRINDTIGIISIVDTNGMPGRRNWTKRLPGGGWQ